MSRVTPEAVLQRVPAPHSSHVTCVCASLTHTLAVLHKLSSAKTDFVGLDRYTFEFICMYVCMYVYIYTVGANPDDFEVFVE